MFPLPREEEHSWTSVIGNPIEECFTCHAWRLDPDPDSPEELEKIYREIRDDMDESLAELRK